MRSRCARGRKGENMKKRIKRTHATTPALLRRSILPSLLFNRLQEDAAHLATEMTHDVHVGEALEDTAEEVDERHRVQNLQAVHVDESVERHGSSGKHQAVLGEYPHDCSTGTKCTRWTSDSITHDRRRQRRDAVEREELVQRQLCAVGQQGITKEDADPRRGEHVGQPRRVLGWHGRVSEHVATEFPQDKHVDDEMQERRVAEGGREQRVDALFVANGLIRACEMALQGLFHHRREARDLPETVDECIDQDDTGKRLVVVVLKLIPSSESEAKEQELRTSCSASCLNALKPARTLAIPVVSPVKAVEFYKAIVPFFPIALRDHPLYKAPPEEDNDLASELKRARQGSTSSRKRRRDP